MNCLWAFLGLLPGEAAGAIHRFMVLEDMMQTGIAWSLLSNCKRTFSQLLRNENILYQENIPRKFKFSFQTQPRNHPSHLPISHKPLHFPTFLSLTVQRTQMLKLFPEYSNAISWAWPNNLVCAFNCNFWQSHLVWYMRAYTERGLGAECAYVFFNWVCRKRRKGSGCLQWDSSYPCEITTFRGGDPSAWWNIKEKGTCQW